MLTLNRLCHFRSTLLSGILALLLVAVFSNGSAQSLPNQKATDETTLTTSDDKLDDSQKERETDGVATEPSPEKAPPVAPEPSRRDKEFTPTEEISEDLPAPFPVDI